MLVSEANTEHNIKRLYAKMSEECSGKIKLPENLTDCVTQNSINFFNNLENCVVDDAKTDDLNIPYDHIYASLNENVDLNVPAVEPVVQTAESEVTFLKKWLLIHLDLIQQQSADLACKDKTILGLQQENETLKEQLRPQNNLQLNNFESLSNSHNSFNHNLEEMTQDGSQIEEDDKSDLLFLNIPNSSAVFDNSEPLKYDDSQCEITPNTLFNSIINETNSLTDISSKTCDTTSNPLQAPLKLDADYGHFADVGLVLNNCPSTVVQEVSTTVQESTEMTNSAVVESETIPKLNDRDNFVVNTPVEDTLNNLRMSIRRKRLCSGSNSNNESGHDDFSLLHPSKKSRRKERKVSVNDEKILIHNEQYVTQCGDNLLGTPGDSDLPSEMCTTNLEVPRWRVKVYTSCYAMEGTENLDDEVYNKRHSRLEVDERRRKKWDIQRIREQRNIEKLKQRQERSGANGKKEQTKPITSFWPTLEDAKYVEITTQLPVTAFGAPIPRYSSSEFNLPWLTNPNVLSMKKPHRKSTTRKKATKR